jgi:ATP-dependent RNA helicase RhlE
MIMPFDTLGLSPELLRVVNEQGYKISTPIQRQAIPCILAGRDVLAGAQTGTGKTAAFALPILQRLSKEETKTKARKIRVLILVPTRELAAQVDESIKIYGGYLTFKSLVIFGGVSINVQMDKLRRGADILVATPGRLLDHLERRTVDLSGVNTLVLDEADRMLDMGFIRDIRKILTVLPKQRQNLMFSATYPAEIKALADSMLNSPVTIEVAKRNSTAETIQHCVHPVDRTAKSKLLSYIIGSRNLHQVLVFTRTKHGADRLARQLVQDGLSATAIHGNKTQGARTRALAEFKSNKVRILVATDIAARGLDIDQLPLVVNFDLPMVAEDYVHRIGRTGRAGNEGQAISLVSVDENRLLKDIERLLKRDIPKTIIPGFEPDPSLKAQAPSPSRNTRPTGRPQSFGGKRQGGWQGGGQGKAKVNSRRGRSGGRGN